MALTRCLECGTRTEGSRCSHCHARREVDEWTARRQIRSGWDWDKIRKAVRARDRACVRCGSTHRLEVHHRIPLADGGANTLDNLELRCQICHRAAHRLHGSQSNKHADVAMTSTRPLVF